MQHLAPFLRYPDRKGAILMKIDVYELEKIRSAMYRDPMYLEALRKNVW